MLALDLVIVTRKSANKMNNIIKKLGLNKTYWFGMATPPFMVFIFLAIENTHFFKVISFSIEMNVFHGYVPGSLAVGLVWMLFGVVIPLLALGRIRCPRCKKRLVLSFLNKGGSEKSPLTSTACPHCGYDPGTDL